MFNDFYDKAVYMAVDNGKDSYGFDIPGVEIDIPIRWVGGGGKTVIKEDGTSISYDKRCHIPREFAVKNGDKLDGLTINEVRPVRGIDGTLEFWAVKVM